MFGVEVVDIRRRPMRVQRSTYVVIGHDNDGIGFTSDWDQPD